MFRLGCELRTSQPVGRSWAPGLRCRVGMPAVGRGSAGCTWSSSSACCLLPASPGRALGLSPQVSVPPPGVCGGQRSTARPCASQTYHLLPSHPVGEETGSECRRNLAKDKHSLPRTSTQASRTPGSNACDAGLARRRPEARACIVTWACRRRPCRRLGSRTFHYTKVEQPAPSPCCKRPMRRAVSLPFLMR